MAERNEQQADRGATSTERHTEDLLLERLARLLARRWLASLDGGVPKRRTGGSVEVSAGAAPPH